jgi:hypothetical protein
MSSAPTTFAIAVGGTSPIVICLALMTRAGRRRNGRKPSSDGGGSDGLTYASGDSGSHFWSSFGSGDSLFGGPGHFGGSHSAGGDSTGGGDSGGGGDGGGGGNGGGGGD